MPKKKEQVSRKNAEGYSDPTAFEAIKNIDMETERFYEATDMMYKIAELFGFYVEEPIVLRDQQSGVIYNK